MIFKHFHDKIESAVQIRKQDPVIDKANRLRLCRVLCDSCRSGESGIYYCGTEIRKIRLKLTDSYEEGVKLSSGTFTLPARFCREILPDDVRSITILLEKSDDDRWYGSY